MKTAQVRVENTDLAQQKRPHCLECGWPGIGNMPAGVRLIKRNGENALIGQLSYYRVSTDLCSVCQAMQSTVASRPWFVEAQAEYLDQVETKKQMLGER